MNAVMRLGAAVGAALSIGSTCVAGTVTWKSEGAKNYTDWTDGANFVGEVAPVAGDTVFLPANGATVYLSDSDMDSFERASSFVQISPADDRTVAGKLVVTVADAGTTLSLQSPVTFDLTASSSGCRVKLVKRGAGGLVLANKESSYAYDSNIVIEEGTLFLPQDTTKNVYLADIAVSNAATLVTAASGSGSHPFTGCENVYCDGVITNRDGAPRYFRPSGRDTVVTERGLVVPNIQWYSSGCSTILSTNNTMTASFGSFFAGTNRLMSIGLVGQPSSAGTGDTVGSYEEGGTILYLGEGETMNRYVNCGSALQGAMSLDAGPHGGLTVAPPSRLIWGKGVALFNLQGDGLKTNFFNGGAHLRTFGSDPTNYYCNVTKRGLGTWRLSRYADNDTRRDAIGTWSVENGTLQFEQLKESGVLDSFGLGNHGFEVGWFGLDPSTHRADYVFAFGSPEGTLPTFEYVGTEHVDCSTRPAILRGDARFVNSGTGNFRFKDISSGAEGTHQLILDGAASSAENAVSGLADGSVGAVGVTKRGDGTWILDGTNTFTGPVKVEGGKLVVRSSTGKYSWFRFTLKEAVNKSNEMQLFELGIYDADGNRINGGLTYATDYTSVQPGETAFTEATSRFYDPPKRLTDKLCDDALSTSWECDILKHPVGKTEGWVNFSRNDETTWAAFVMRLDPSCAAAARYDMVSSSDYPTCRPSVWTVEGSVDGKVWDPLDSVTDDVPAPRGKYWWLYANEDYTAGTAGTHEGGRPLTGASARTVTVLSEDAEVSVAAGAELAAEGRVVVGKLAVDTKGAGTIRGVEFAEEGTLNVEGIARGAKAVTLPGTYENVIGLENLSNWTVAFDGKRSKGASVMVKDGVLTVVRSGLVITVK